VESGRSVGPPLAPIACSPLQLTRKVNYIVDCAVDDAGLEAGVGVAKRYRGGHNSAGGLKDGCWQQGVRRAQPGDECSGSAWYRPMQG
jgi:hypothetical protein